MFRLFGEISTPFVSIHFLLTTHDAWRKSSVVTVNGVLMILMFFGARIVMLPLCVIEN